MPDRTIVMGFFVIAGLAWALPGVSRLADQVPPLPKSIVYAVETQSAEDSPRLLWSPPGALETPARLRGHVASPEGIPLRLITGWEGLLLGTPLDLNAATAADLGALPGIGSKTASSILATREELGRFERVDDLLAVSGIGPKKLARLRPLVRVIP